MSYRFREAKDLKVNTADMKINDVDADIYIYIYSWVYTQVHLLSSFNQITGKCKYCKTGGQQTLSLSLFIYIYIYIKGYGYIHPVTFPIHGIKRCMCYTWLPKQRGQNKHSKIPFCKIAPEKKKKKTEMGTTDGYLVKVPSSGIIFLSWVNILADLYFGICSICCITAVTCKRSLSFG